LVCPEVPAEINASDNVRTRCFGYVPTVYRVCNNNVVGIVEIVVINTVIVGRVEIYANFVVRNIVVNYCVIVGIGETYANFGVRYIVINDCIIVGRRENHALAAVVKVNTTQCIVADYIVI
jgi:Na+-translocating ferredoxin:NAD+ oxidoreductase RnfE subunit